MDVESVLIIPSQREHIPQHQASTWEDQHTPGEVVMIETDLMIGAMIVIHIEIVTVGGLHPLTTDVHHHHITDGVIHDHDPGLTLDRQDVINVIYHSCTPWYSKTPSDCKFLDAVVMNLNSMQQCFQMLISTHMSLRFAIVH